MVSEKEIKVWYNQRHKSLKENAWRPYEAYSIFLDHLNVAPEKKLLDIGCGTGYLLKAADQQGLETYGIDISDEGVKIAKKSSPNSKIIVGKGEDINFSDNYFDYVTCIGALEHFLDMEKALKEMLRVTKKDASFCIVVPNINYLDWRRGNKGTVQQDINENLLSLKQWKKIFMKEGFKIIKIHQDRWFMKNIDVFSSTNPIVIIKRSIRKLMWVFLPLNRTYQFIFIMSKK